MAVRGMTLSVDLVNLAVGKTLCSYIIQGERSPQLQLRGTVRTKVRHADSLVQTAALQRPCTVLAKVGVIRSELRYMQMSRIRI